MNTMATIALVTLGIVSVASTVSTFYLWQANMALKSTIALQGRLFRSEIMASTFPTHIASLPKQIQTPTLPKKRTFKQRFMDCFQ